MKLLLFSLLVASAAAIPLSAEQNESEEAIDEYNTWEKTIEEVVMEAVAKVYGEEDTPEGYAELERVMAGVERSMTLVDEKFGVKTCEKARQYADIINRVLDMGDTFTAENSQCESLGINGTYRLSSYILNVITDSMIKIIDESIMLKQREKVAFIERFQVQMATMLLQSLAPSEKIVEVFQPHEWFLVTYPLMKEENATMCAPACRLVDIYMRALDVTRHYKRECESACQTEEGYMSHVVANVNGVTAGMYENMIDQAVQLSEDEKLYAKRYIYQIMRMFSEKYL